MDLESDNLGSATTDDAQADGSTQKLRLTLLENAYHSLNVSLRHVEFDSNGPSWKIAILLLVHTLELFLKERLRRAHPLLINSNVDRPGHTASLEVALRRLQSIGVAVERSDESAIARAVEWRDKIMHYELEASPRAIEATYAVVFEFLSSFHDREFEEDLHAHVDEDNWWTESILMEIFRSDTVPYHGTRVMKDWPATIMAAQDLLQIQIEGAWYDRIRYGSASMWLEVNPTYAAAPCHDCDAVAGQFHVPDCDMEQCPRCNWQLISCGCAVTAPVTPPEEDDGIPSTDYRLPREPRSGDAAPGLEADSLESSEQLT
jgi:hypothetical protein